MSHRLTLVSHDLCPYVQRIAIALAEKAVDVEQVTIDLAAKPDWFKAISPLGKVPLLRVGDQVIFESAVILEYLEDTVAPPLHPRDALQRADHRAWMDFGSTILNDIAGLYNAPDEASFDAKRAQIAARFLRLERRLVAGPWFDGEYFSLVDAVFAPVFRYFDTFDELSVSGMLGGAPKVARWRAALASRPSVRTAVVPDYPQRLKHFLAARKSHISQFAAAAPADERSVLGMRHG